MGDAYEKRHALRGELLAIKRTAQQLMCFTLASAASSAFAVR
ncbi:MULTISPECIES: hypothetical protein [unclassified Paraburkholderia]|nr:MULTISPECIES: hypothetical protein [unclassified Paraburkholderia]MBB5412270.1 hypothetical protein [Paraburkholderia sp. HC6.4b]MBB5463818.1 hypothetical protein [Paraburkholderia sp. Cpub6]